MKWVQKQWPTFRYIFRGCDWENHEKSIFLGQYYNPAYHKQKATVLPSRIRCNLPCLYTNTTRICNRVVTFFLKKAVEHSMLDVLNYTESAEEVIWSYKKYYNVSATYNNNNNNNNFSFSFFTYRTRWSCLPPQSDSSLPPRPTQPQTVAQNP